MEEALRGTIILTIPTQIEVDAAKVEGDPTLTIIKELTDPAVLASALAALVAEGDRVFWQVDGEILILHP